MTNWIRKILYTILPQDWYFGLLSKGYLICFRLGLLKNNEYYLYPYFLNKIIKKNDICIDIGANMGYMTTLYSRLVGKNGKVYAVEPVKPMLAALRRNTKGMSNVEILPYALGTENKTVQLGNNTLHKQGFMSSGRHEIIESESETDVRFDATMKRGSELFQNFTRVDFIKCDIEGYETIVIPEIKPIILKHKPVMLVESRDEDRKQMLEFFSSIGYESFILSQGKLIPAAVEDFLDLLTIPNEKISEFKHLLK